jgi:hypothetical protein
MEALSKIGGFLALFKIAGFLTGYNKAQFEKEFESKHLRKLVITDHEGKKQIDSTMANDKETLLNVINMTTGGDPN